jgi:hypothetical protein
MARPDTAKPATDIGEPAPKIEQLGGQLELENNRSHSFAQPETAVASAMRASLARREVSR